MSAPPIGPKLQHAYERMTNFDASDYICGILLKREMQIIRNDAHLQKQMLKLVKRKEERLLALYLTALKEEMAKLEEDQCWQKV